MSYQIVSTASQGATEATAVAKQQVTAAPVVQVATSPPQETMISPTVSPASLARTPTLLRTRSNLTARHVPPDAFLQNGAKLPSMTAIYAHTENIRPGQDQPRAQTALLVDLQPMGLETLPSVISVLWASIKANKARQDALRVQ